MSMPTRENRRAPRSRHNSVMEIFDDSGNLLTSIGRLVDVSMVGACFSSTKTFTKGQTFRARLRLLKEGKLDVMARVVWSRKKTNSTLYGVEFDARKKL